MKMDVKVKLSEKTVRKIGIGTNSIVVPVDLDYISDYNELAFSVEDRLYHKLGVSLYCKVDFEIENATEICENLS